MIQLKPLCKGDTIGIISTARKISKDELLPAVEKLESWGLKVKLGKNLFEEFHQFAGTDQQRTDDLQYMLDDDSIDAIVCARGGYGTVRIIDKIDFTKFISKPKWIIGYSDVTVLHSHIHNLGIETLHAIMPINFPKDGEENLSISSLKEALFSGKLEYRFDSNSLNFNDSLSAPIIGGNLSMLYSLLGSPSDISTKGKILFFEDLDEYLYHIDRMMMNLKRNGKFDKPAAIVIGGLSDMNDNQIPFGFNAEQVVTKVLESETYPIIFGFPAGHQLDNRAIILGRNAKFRKSENQIIFNQ